LVAALIAVTIVIGTSFMMMGYDGTVGAIVPATLVLTFVVLRWPWMLLGVTLAQFSTLPIKDYLSGTVLDALADTLSLMGRLAESDVDVVMGPLPERLRTALEPGRRRFMQHSFLVGTSAEPLSEDAEL